MKVYTEKNKLTRDWSSLSKHLELLVKDKERPLPKGVQNYWTSLLEFGEEFEACEQWSAADSIYNQVKVGLKKLEKKEHEEIVSIDLSFQNVSEELTALCYQDIFELLKNTENLFPLRERKYFQDIIKKQQSTNIENSITHDAEPQLIGRRDKKLIQNKSQNKESLYQVREEIVNKLEYYYKVQKKLSMPITCKDKKPKQVGTYNSLNTLSRVITYLSEKDPLWVHDFYEYFGSIQEIKELFIKNKRIHK